MTTGQMLQLSSDLADNLGFAIPENKHMECISTKSHGKQEEYETPFEQIRLVP